MIDCYYYYYGGNIMSNKYKTFSTKQNQSILTVTFDYPPVNIQGIPMINDLNILCTDLEQDKTVKVVVFESANPDFFIAHADVNMLQNMSTTPVPRDKVKLDDLALVLQRVSLLPQATIAKIEGYARGGGNELCLACDMRFASQSKAVFMHMEVGLGILPSGGGSARLAKIVGLGNALEFILSARDYDSSQAEKIGLVNKTLPDDQLCKYVDELASRISKFPAEAITACKRAIYASVDMPTSQALIEETYQLYQATSQTPAVKRFTQLAETNFQDSLENQRNFQSLLMTMQD